MNRSSSPKTHEGREVLWEDGERKYCRVRRRDGNGDLEDCIAVLSAAEHPTADDIGRLSHEYALREHLDGSWALRPLDLVRERGQTILIVEYQDGVPLDRLIAPRIEVGRFLRLAVALGSVLARMHERAMIHKDIKPANILVDLAGDRIWLTGFGIATRLPRERVSPQPPGLIAGTLAYMAPEQTGRMNRSIDARSDLYSLGVTLYQALTGSLPFTASEPMEWVHCHIARRPTPPAERLENVPSQVSAIIMKLLAKTPEERYQTAAGVTRDLRRCAIDWQCRTAIDEFQLGESDSSDRLLIPERLYGRENEIDALLASFKDVVTSGTPRLVVVRGAPGIGKSSVVNELHKVLVAPFLFASGKFDRLKRDVPYATLAHALETLFRQVLRKPEVELRRWRDDIIQALHPNGVLIVELVPELALIIGEQPSVPDLSAPSAKARFQRTLRRLIGVFARPEQPLALFLDDLQWLDAATLDMIEDLLIQPDLRHLLLIGAYRDNEVDATHPLMRKLSVVRRKGGIVREIDLAPLRREDLAPLIMDTLHCGPQGARSLAQLLHQKTAGNPFFANQFMHALVEDGLIAFDPDSERWCWDLRSIEVRGYTENVVDLMNGKLSRLPVHTQDALMDLACLGNSAEISILAIVREMTEEDVHADLWAALRSELVFRSENAYQFVHDRVHEAAYSLIPEEMRAHTHLRIGRALRGQLQEDERDEAIFAIVNQLNRGSTLITSQNEREAVAELNLKAAGRARTAAAYDSALHYLTAGAELVEEGCWEGRRDLIFELSFHRAESEFLTGQAKAAEDRVIALTSQAENVVELAATTCLLADIHVALQRVDRSVAVCLDYLRQAGLDIPMQPTRAEAQAAYDRIWTKIRGRPIEKLVELPIMTDPASRATLDVLAKISRSALTHVDMNLLSLVLCAAVELCLEQGNCDSSCYAYEYFGVIAAWQFGDFEAGIRFGRLGYDLVERKGLRQYDALVCLTLANRVMPWAEHIRTCRDLISTAFDLANKSGDRISAVSSRCVLVSNMLMAGETLDEVESEAEAGLGFCRRAGFRDFIDAADTQAALVRSLRGHTRQFGSFDDDRFDERDLQTHYATQPHVPVFECWYWIRRLQARFIAGDYAAALDASARAKALLFSSAALLEVAEFEFYSGLTHAAACDAGSVDERQQHLDAVTAHHRQLDLWARQCPYNFEDRAALVAAEIARLERRDSDAMHLYEQAMRSARENGFVHIEALAAELAANFYTGRGFDRIARAYLGDARHAFLQWGAEGKVRQLDEWYPYLTDDAPRSDPARTLVTPVEQLDLVSVLKVLEAVSGETDLETLLRTVLCLALEHAGAQRGLLILPRDDGFRIEADAEIAQDGVRVGIRQSAITFEELPESVLQYALRTKEAVLLRDASAENPFADDEYLRRHRARSVLCMPLLKQTRLVGLLYLENNLASGVFTPARIAVLKLLGSEAAITMENARLYHDLQERETRVRRLVDSNIIGVVIWHADGRILDANEAFLRIVGYDLDDLVSGRTGWTELTPAEWHERDAQVLADIRSTGTVQAHEREYIRKDGTRVPVLVAGAIFDGMPDEGVAFVVDLTERKHAEQAQRASEHESRSIVEAIPGLVALLGANGEVESVNHQIVDYFGQTSEELKRWGTNDTIHADDLGHVIEVFTQSVAAGTPYVIVQRFKRWDGVYRWFENRGFPLRNEEGRIVRWCVLLTDIDERKRAEEALRSSERELKLIIDTIPALAWSARLDGSAEFFNDHYLDFVGLSAEQASGWGWTAAVHPDDLNDLAATWQRIMASETAGEVEARLRRYDGEYRWFLFRANPLRDEFGSIVRWYGINTDIEDRKRAEDAVRVSERNLQLTIDTIPTLVWSARPDGSAEFLNQHYLDFIGLPPEEVSAWNWAMAVHPDDIAGLTAAWQRQVGSEAPGDAEARLRRYDGEYRWFIFRANPLRDESGVIVKWYGVNTDIEDRKKAEAELRRTYTYLAEAQRLSRCGSFFSDMAGNERIWSDEMYRILELDPATRVTGQLFRSMVHPEDVSLYDAQFARLLAGNNLETGFRVVTARGAVKHVRSICHILEWKDGHPVCFGAVQDVTETAVAEEALNRARAELAHVARAATLNALTASIAHEVNQPLSGIITNASTCVRMLDADPPDVDGARNTARRTIRDCQRASDVITRLRALFGRKEFTLEPMDLTEATREVIALSLSDLQRNRVMLRSELADDLPPAVGDRVQLQQVILNLLINASEAMAGVEDRPRQLLIRTEHEVGDSLRVTVTDTGAGIDPQSVDRIFDAFHTTKSGGMGIGLSVSRSIIERHHGRLWAEPNEGPGATFAFSIPCRPESGGGRASA